MQRNGFIETIEHPILVETVGAEVSVGGDIDFFVLRCARNRHCDEHECQKAFSDVVHGICVLI